MTKFLAVLVSFYAIPLMAQFEPGNVPVRGEVSGGIPVGTTTLSIEAYNSYDHLRVGQALVSSNGNFDLGPVPSGNYELRVVSQNGDVLTMQFVTVKSNMPYVTFELPEQHARNRPASGSVDFGQLSHKVDPQALRTFQKAVKAITAEDHKNAVQLLQKAIQADQDYAEAHLELAIQYSFTGEADRSFEESKIAVRLAPGSAQAHLNLAIVLFHRNLLPDAEAEARAASRLAPTNAKANYLTGAILVGEGKLTPETLAYLRKAYEDYPNARELGARLEKRLAQ